jgi:hypothetical protein
MDARKVVVLGGLALAAVGGVVVGAYRAIEDLLAVPFDDAPIEAAPSAEGAAQVADDDAPALYGVPTAEQQARLADAAKESARPKTLQDLLQDAPAPKEPDVFVPAVVPEDQRTYRAAPGTGAEPEKPLSPDVVGLERALLARSEVIDTCVRWNAPTHTGKDSVQVDFTLVPDGASSSRIDKLEIKADTTGRYASFARCLLDATGDVRFTALRDPQRVVSKAFPH